MAMTDEHRELCWRLREHAAGAREAKRLADDNVMTLAAQAIEALYGEPARARPRDDGTEVAVGGEPGASPGRSE